MKFLHLLTKRIIISRMVATSGYKVAMTTVTAAFSEIQPLSYEKTQEVDGVFGKTFKIFVDIDCDIKQGDMLKGEDGIRYQVVGGGVVARSQGSIEYKEGIIMIAEENNV